MTDDERPDLTAEQIRVLGALIEKERTTPDQYPLSTNALVAACNQKNNRDPVVAYDARLVDTTMLSLREGGLARTVRPTGNRAHKHRHVLDEAWHLDDGQLAVLAVLMLRGPQSAGELRTRTERYIDGADTATIEAILSELAGLDEPLAVNIGRDAGQSVHAAAPRRTPETPQMVPPERAAVRRHRTAAWRLRSGGCVESRRRVPLLRAPLRHGAARGARARHQSGTRPTDRVPRRRRATPARTGTLS